MDLDSGTTIGLTKSSREIADSIIEKGWFGSKLSLGRLAFAVAVNDDVEFKSIEGAETVWNLGSFDQDGKMRMLINTLHPNKYNTSRLIECYVNTGLHKINDIIVSENIQTSADLLDAVKIDNS